MNRCWKAFRDAVVARKPKPKPKQQQRRETNNDDPENGAAAAPEPEKISVVETVASASEKESLEEEEEEEEAKLKARLDAVNKEIMARLVPHRRYSEEQLQEDPVVMQQIYACVLFAVMNPPPDQASELRASVRPPEDDDDASTSKPAVRFWKRLLLPLGRKSRKSKEEEDIGDSAMYEVNPNPTMMGEEYDDPYHRPTIGSSLTIQ